MRQAADAGRAGGRGAAPGWPASTPRALWELAEAAFVEWCELGKPDRDRFGVTVTGDRQE
ncbi:hypothetical protein ILP97_51415, partial [Amycolatopsis sp. H6(2020)]|nr:hypothetical protein [Amycolatopsis sp. H6(2020)]